MEHLTWIILVCLGCALGILAYFFRRDANERFRSKSALTIVPAEGEFERSNEGLERVSARLIIETVQALSKADEGRRIDVAGRAEDVEVPPLVVVRLLSDLVNDAVLRTGGERILIGARCRETAVVIEIYDSGANPLKIPVELQRRAEETAETHGWKFHQRERCAGGYRSQLWLPRVGYSLSRPAS